jgi:hypothetical protein
MRASVPSCVRAKCADNQRFRRPHSHVTARERVETFPEADLKERVDRLTDLRRDLQDVSDEILRLHDGRVFITAFSAVAHSGRNANYRRRSQRLAQYDHTSKWRVYVWSKSPLRHVICAA